MIDRLAAAILLSDRSLSSLAEAAKLGRNYVSQMLANETPPTNDALIAICNVLQVDAHWVMTGIPRNSKLDGLLEICANLDFASKKSVFRALSRGSEQPIGRIRQLSKEYNLSLTSLQEWIEHTDNPNLTDTSTLAFEELSSLAAGQEIDMVLMREALEEAYEIENQVLGQLGPVQKRAKLVREIYNLKRHDAENRT
ncbi:MAG: helix-turn-helix domain-containing protein [Hyphomicrobiales bacterium]